MPFLYLQFLYIILNYREITLIKEPNDEPIYGTLPVIGCHISHDPVVAPSYPVPRCSTAPGLCLRIFGRSLKEVQEQLLLLSLAGQRHDGTGWNWILFGRASPSSTPAPVSSNYEKNAEPDPENQHRENQRFTNSLLARAEKPWIRPNFWGKV